MYPNSAIYSPPPRTRGGLPVKKKKKKKKKSGASKYRCVVLIPHRPAFGISALEDLTLEDLTLEDLTLEDLSGDRPQIEQDLG